MEARQGVRTPIVVTGPPQAVHCCTSFQKARHQQYFSAQPAPSLTLSSHQNQVRSSSRANHASGSSEKVYNPRSRMNLPNSSFLTLATHPRLIVANQILPESPTLAIPCFEATYNGRSGTVSKWWRGTPSNRTP